MTYVISAKRCGSTLIQNIGHLIVHGKKGRLVKHHDSNQNPKGKLLIPIRDPRDVAVSIRRTLIKDFHLNKKDDSPITDLKFLEDRLVLNQLNIMGRLYRMHRNNENALIIRYEDMFKDGLGKYEHVTKKICEFVNVEYTDELMEMINTELDFDKLKKISDSMSTFKQDDTKVGFTMIGLHGGHIKSTSVSDWKTAVPENLHDQMNKRLAGQIELLRYNA